MCPKNENVLISSCGCKICDVCIYTIIFCVVFGICICAGLSNILIVDFSKVNFFIEDNSSAFKFPLIYCLTPDIIFCFDSFLIHLDNFFLLLDEMQQGLLIYQIFYLF